MERQFDGKNYPVTGDSTSDIQPTRRLTIPPIAPAELLHPQLIEGWKGYDEQAWSFPGRQSRTVTVSGTDPNGNQINTTAVYNKQ
jgi:hypothetical protein